MALLRERGLVLADIGLLFGRDHSTVHTAVERAIPELENPTPELLEARRLLAEAERAPFSCSACGEPRTPRHFGIVCPSCGGAWVGVEPHRSAAPG
jgi:Zn finger protein HypA/HybF involved in hydrogenase expression